MKLSKLLLFTSLLPFLAFSILSAASPKITWLDQKNPEALSAEENLNLSEGVTARLLQKASRFFSLSNMKIKQLAEKIIFYLEFYTIDYLSNFPPEKLNESLRFYQSLIDFPTSPTAPAPKTVAAKATQTINELQREFYQEMIFRIIQAQRKQATKKDWIFVENAKPLEDFDDWDLVIDFEEPN